MTVEDFAVRPNPWWRGRDSVGVARGTLDEIGFGSDRVVDVVCGSPESGMELAVQTTRPREENAATYGWRVTYVVRGVTETFEFPVWLQQCCGPAWEPDCEALRPHW